jgi:heme/copper-type cytochrome/quinol oxidase subunit 3
VSLGGRRRDRGQKKRRTSWLVTGLWLVLLNSSIVFGSFLKSFFVPTRTIGSPEQK